MGGWNKKPIEQHVADGTYHATRHGPLWYVCQLCEKKWLGHKKKFCSRACQNKYHQRKNKDKRFPERHKLVCARCGKHFACERKHKFCTRECATAFRRSPIDSATRNANRCHGRRQRMRIKEGGERFDKIEIYERDGWRCGICGKKVRRDKKWPHPRSPSLDHIVPLAKGGKHVRTNVRCACLVCNCVTKQDSLVAAQFRLFG